MSEKQKISKGNGIGLNSFYRRNISNKPILRNGQKKKRREMHVKDSRKKRMKDKRCNRKGVRNINFEMKIV